MRRRVNDVVADVVFDHLSDEWQRVAVCRKR
jgi:hypothetical protein